MSRSWLLMSVMPALLTAALGCADRGARERELEQRRVALGREVAGLRQLVAGLERGEPFVAPDHVIIAIDETLVRDLIAAQLPFETDVERFHIRLTGAEVRFHGSPVVHLHGEARLRESPAIAGTLSVLGAIEDITIDGTSGILRARLAVDEISIQKAAGLEAWLSAGALDELAITLRSGLVALLPPLEIPVSVRQRIDVPAVTSGPVLIRASAMPLRAAVTRVVAGRGKLWIGVRVQAGDVVRSVAAGASGVGAPEPEASSP